jgi:hypothetical protein
MEETIMICRQDLRLIRRHHVDLLRTSSAACRA